ncbi:RfbX Membrane protein involved in the export of O-antigen and teichoic acid [Rhabdaerophilaceae bacterium]
MQSRTSPAPLPYLTGLVTRISLANLFSGAVGAMGVRVIAAALSYLLQIVLARMLGTADYGTFSFSWNVITIGGFLATLGFGQIAIRYLAEYHQQNSSGLARGFIRESFVMTGFGSLVLIIGIYSLFSLFERGYGHASSMVLFIGLLAIPFFALTDIVEGFARSQGWVIRALAPTYIGRSGLLLAGMLVLSAFEIRPDAVLAMAVALLATIGACIWQLSWTLPTLYRIFPKTGRLRDAVVWRASAGPTLLADVMLLARQSVDLVILGLLAPPAVVGIYFAATKIASLIGLIEFAIGATYGHRFARASLSGPAERLLKFREARRVMQMSGIGSAIALAIFLPFILMLFGPAFGESLWPALILVFAAALRMAAGPMEDLLIVCGDPAGVWRANLIGALFSATICLVLAGPLGAVGAALGAGIGNLAATGMLLLAYRRDIGSEQVA